MKVITIATRGFCLLSGLVMAPLLVALLLAFSMGVLPSFDRFRSALLDPQSANAATDANDNASSSATASTAPADVSYWERRLSGVSGTIIRDRADVDQRLAEVKERSAKLGKLQESLEQLLEAVLGREFAGEELVTNAESVRAELEALTSAERRFPTVLDTAKTMSPKALAAILTARAGDAVADDVTKSKKQTAKLLRRLKPRTTGKVLEAMAKIDAGYARELIEFMGGAAVGGLAGGK